ncbi:hypothetical protein MKW92_004240, partial [Papaver armeniacum]
RCECFQVEYSIDAIKNFCPIDKMSNICLRHCQFVFLTTGLIKFMVIKHRRYGCRAMMLETVAAVPGMLLHCKSLRRFEHSGNALLEEAKNERMHLMTFIEVAKSKWYERALVIAVQVVSHRIVGYLEEEAIHSYTEFLKELDKGTIENVKALAIAIEYWRLPADAILKDFVMVVRADEAHHRDVNHFASVRLHSFKTFILLDIHVQGHELKESVSETCVFLLE